MTAALLRGVAAARRRRARLVGALPVLHRGREGRARRAAVPAAPVDAVSLAQPRRPAVRELRRLPGDVPLAQPQAGAQGAQTRGGARADASAPRRAPSSTRATGGRCTRSTSRTSRRHGGIPYLTSASSRSRARRWRTGWWRRWPTGAANRGRHDQLREGTHLYGRYWGCLADFQMLHFELCYYRLIERAIERRCTLFEAGAQGEHKLKRGLVPAFTHSAHWIRNPALADAVAAFIAARGRRGRRGGALFDEHSPFRAGRGAIRPVAWSPSRLYRPEPVTKWWLRIIPSWRRARAGHRRRRLPGRRRGARGAGRTDRPRDARSRPTSSRSATTRTRSSRVAPRLGRAHRREAAGPGSVLRRAGARRGGDHRGLGSPPPDTGRDARSLPQPAPAPATRAGRDARRRRRPRLAAAPVRLEPGVSAGAAINGTTLAPSARSRSRSRARTESWCPPSGCCWWARTPWPRPRRCQAGAGSGLSRPSARAGPGRRLWLEARTGVALTLLDISGSSYPRNGSGVTFDPGIPFGSGSAPRCAARVAGGSTPLSRYGPANQDVYVQGAPGSDGPARGAALLGLGRLIWRPVKRLGLRHEGPEGNIARPRPGFLSVAPPRRRLRPGRRLAVPGIRRQGRRWATRLGGPSSRSRTSCRRSSWSRSAGWCRSGPRRRQHHDLAVPHHRADRQAARRKQRLRRLFGVAPAIERGRRAEGADAERRARAAAGMPSTACSIACPNATAAS